MITASAAGKEMDTATSPIGVIAGNGTLPLAVLSVLKARGRSAYVVAIRGEAGSDLRDTADIELGFGEIGKLFKSLKKAGCEQLILIGGIANRPDFKSAMADPGTIRRLPRILKALKSGDDSLLTKVIGLFEEEGFRVVGLKDVAPSLLASEGLLTAIGPTEQGRQDLDLARQAVNRLGELDIGQAAVAVEGRVVALEGAEGTDAMLERCAELREKRRIRGPVPSGVLVKTAKPKQDLRVDLPTIGPRTIDLVRAAGLAGIGVEAGKTLIAEPEKTLSAARDAGLFLIGFAGGDDKGEG